MPRDLFSETQIAPTGGMTAPPPAGNDLLMQATPTNPAANNYGFQPQVLRAATFGLSDKVDALAHTRPLTRAYNAMTGNEGDLKSFTDLYHEGLEQARKAGEDYSKDKPWLSGAATTLGTVAALPANAAMTGANTLGQMMKQGGQIGALSGFGAADDKSLSGDLSSTLIGTGMGMGTAGAMGVGSRAMFPNVSRGVSEFANEGGKPSIGQILGNGLDDKLSELPFTSGAINQTREAATDKFFRTTVDKALEPIGEKLSPSTPIGQQGVAEMMDKVGAVYDRFAKNTVVPFNPTTDLAVARSKVPQSLQGDFDTFVKQAITDRMKNGELTGAEWKAARDKLGDLSERYINRGTAHEMGLGEGLELAQDALHTALGRSSPEASAELANANQAWAMAKRVNRAANYADAVKNGGVFDPAQYLQAVTATGGGKAGSGRAPGQAWAQSAYEALGDNKAMTGPGLTAGSLAMSPVTAPLGAISRLGYGPANDIMAYLARTNRPTSQMMAQFLQRAAPTAAARSAQPAPGLLDQSAWQ